MSPRLLLTILIGLLVGGATLPRALPVGARYVAMGSSYAAGPGITHAADVPTTRCARSADNYPHQLARALRLTLVDVSCSGATTANLIAAWDELPAQLDAVTAATRLVTVTIGGNDLHFVEALYAAACVPGAGVACAPLPVADAARFATVAAALTRIGREARRRAPAARVIFVEYPTVLPAHGTCAATPMTAASADAIRALAAGLARATARAAAASGAGLLRASALSRGHDVCSAVPWMTGYRGEAAAAVAGAEVPYHPNLAGASAVAAALARQLGAAATGRWARDDDIRCASGRSAPPPFAIVNGPPPPARSGRVILAS